MVYPNYYKQREDDGLEDLEILLKIEASRATVFGVWDAASAALQDIPSVQFAFLVSFGRYPN